MSCVDAGSDYSCATVCFCFCFIDAVRADAARADYVFCVDAGSDSLRVVCFIDSVRADAMSVPVDVSCAGTVGFVRVAGAEIDSKLFVCVECARLGSPDFCMYLWGTVRQNP